MATAAKGDSLRWWLTEPGSDDSYKNIFTTVRTLHLNSRERLDRNMRCLRMYGNFDLIGVGPGSYTQSITPALPENRVKINIVSSMVDTSGARISKMKPKVQFLTSGGDFTSQKDARNLTKFMLGAFYQNQINKLHQVGFRDAQIFDIGAIKHYIADGKICSERTLPLELYTDPFDSLYGRPLTLYQLKYVSRGTLQEQFPEFKTQIMQARDEIDSTIKTQEEIEDYVVVIEAWRKPSVADGDDGRHVVCIGNHALVDEKYDKDYFPFTFFRWSESVLGFYGQSLAERLTSLQLEINKMLRIIQRSFHLGSAFRVFLEYGSKISKEHINNDIGSIIYYMGKEPIFNTPSVVHQEYFAHLKWLISSAYQEAGISQMTSASQLPAGIDGASGRAVREYNNLETERFALVSQNYEATFLETAKIYVDLADEISKSGGNFKVTGQSKAFIEEIRWKDVAPVNKNAYIMQMFPTSMLPHEPAGRLAFVQELITSGMIPASFGAELLDFPDLESYMSIKNAAVEDLLATLEQLVEGDFCPPEPYQDLVNGLPWMQSAYLRAKRQKVSQKGLENIQQWIAQADALMQKAAQQQQQQAQAQQQLAQAQQNPPALQGAQAAQAPAQPQQ